MEDEARGWRKAGVDVVVSLLEDDEQEQLVLSAEASVAQANGMRFVSFPVPDRGVPPSTQAAVALLRDLGRTLEQGENVAVHCRQGIGRSALIAAGLLVASGSDPEMALETVGSSRGLKVPETPEQERWVQRLSADRLVEIHR
ncbi:MAG: tyrosine protein phosphatase [Terriglobia bacterium]|nr:MAG: tyrosine protein phosphatase [Terriglobia bacterium]